MSSPYIGEIRMFGGSFAPAGWALCQGQLMPISQNDTLFNLIGTTYGGDGQQTFGLPDCQGRVPVHMGTLAGGGTYQIGETAGTESVTLNTSQMPNHNHPWVVSQDGATQNSPASNVLASTIAIKNWSPFPGTASFNNNAVTSVGGNQPHENMMPYLCITFIISLFGIFPSQN